MYLRNRGSIRAVLSGQRVGARLYKWSSTPGKICCLNSIRLCIWHGMSSWAPFTLNSSSDTGSPENCCGGGGAPKTLRRQFLPARRRSFHEVVPSSCSGGLHASIAVCLVPSTQLPQVATDPRKSREQGTSAVGNGFVLAAAFGGPAYRVIPSFRLSQRPLSQDAVPGVETAAQWTRNGGTIIQDWAAPSRWQRSPDTEPGTLCPCEAVLAALLPQAANRLHSPGSQRRAPL